MLKNFGYDGVYYNQDITVSVLLENPSDYDLEATTLVFSVTIKDKRSGTTNLHLEDFSFYIMDEQNYIYNTKKAIGLQSSVNDNEPVRNPDILILTEFRPEFLFQDLRIAFYYEPCQQFHIIELKH